MRASTNIELKNRKTAVLQNFGGVDFSSSPLRVAYSRAADLQNLYCKDGILQKRPGWSEITAQSNFDAVIPFKSGKVNGIYRLDKDRILAHVGTQLIAFQNNQWTTKSVLREDLLDAPSQVFYKDGVMYLITGKDILSVDINDESYSFQSLRESAYIPTTTISINADNSDENNQSALLDEPNVLTPYRKNTLLGSELKLANNGDDAHPQYELQDVCYTLDAEVDDNSNVSVEILLGANSETDPLVLTADWSDFDAERKKYGTTVPLKRTSKWDGAYLFPQETMTVNPDEDADFEIGPYDDNGYTTLVDEDYYLTNSESVPNLYDGPRQNFFAMGIGSVVCNYTRTKFGRLIGVEKTIDTDTQLTDFASYETADTLAVIPWDPTDTGYGYLYLEEGKPTKIYLSIGTKSAVGGSDNITVTFSHSSNITVRGRRRNRLLKPGTHETTTIENPADIALPQSYKITLCRFGVEFGVDGRSNRLFLSGNPYYPNVDFWSEINDYTYFPESNFAKVGSSARRISGYAKLSENRLAIFKENIPGKNADDDETIYYRSGSSEIKLNSDGDIDTYRDVFRLSEGITGKVLSSRQSIVNLHGDIMALAPEGVFGLVFNPDTVEHKVYSRSSFIDAKLRTYATVNKQEDNVWFDVRADETINTYNERNSCAAIVYKNRMYLSFPYEENCPCYVADSDYKVSGKNGSQYEWWCWTNIPATAWAIIDDQLYFGTPDGKLCVFEDNRGYYDSVATVLEQGDIVLKTLGADNYDNTPSYIAKAQDGMAIRLDDCGEILGDIIAINMDGVFTVSEETINKLYNGKQICFYGTEYAEHSAQFDTSTRVLQYLTMCNDAQHYDMSGQQLHAKGSICNSCYTITDVDYVGCTFRVISNAALYQGEIYCPTEPENISVLPRFIYSPIDFDCFVYRADDGEFCVYRQQRKGNSEELYMRPMRIVNLNPSERADRRIGVLQNRSNVVAIWTSATMDMGTTMYAKTLLRLTLGISDRCGAGLCFGYQTSDSDIWYGAKGIGSLDFGTIDFSNFVLDKEFARSYTLRCNERNFNFIRFRLLSATDQNFAVESLTAMYKINSANLGVR